MLSASPLQGVAASVRVLDLPGLGPKDDIIDWIKAGGTREQLLELVTKAAHWQAPKPERATTRPLAEGGVSLDDFVAYLPDHAYLFTPTREMWPATSINARIPPVPLVDDARQPVLNEKNEPVELRANTWLDQNKPVEQMTWAPGLPMLIRDRLVDNGGWIERDGVTTFNLIARRRSSSATRPRPARGSTTCARCSRTIPTTP